MKCERCNKDIPEDLDYCPTCKINDYKESENQPKPIEIAMDNNNQDTIQAIITSKEEPEKLDFTKKWDITLYYFLVSVFTVLVLLFTLWVFAEKFDYNNTTGGRIGFVLVISFICAFYALYVEKYISKTYLWVLYLITSFAIYSLMSLMVIVIIIIAWLDDYHEFVNLLLLPFFWLFLLLPVVLTNEAKNTVLRHRPKPPQKIDSKK